MLSLFDEEQARIVQLGRVAHSVLRLHELLRRRPIISIRDASARLNMSQPTVATCLRHLAELRIVSEITGRKRDRIFAYDKYLAILQEGTAPA
jgi:Fic family protein